MGTGNSLKKFLKIAVIIMAEAAMLLLCSCQNSEREKAIEQLSERYSVPEDKQLIVYTSHKEEVYLPIIREFESRTGIWVDVHAGGTAEMMQAAREASLEGQCDIMFGGGIESYEAQKDIFLPYETSESDMLDNNYLSEGDYFTPFTELPIVFIYNKKLVSTQSAPDTWEELFNERWKGKIAFADPHNSGTSYTILSTMQQLFKEEASSLVPRFYAQLEGQVLSSSGDVIPEVANGNCLVGITLEETAKKYIAAGYDISMRYPEDGTSAVPDGCAMLRNAPHSYNAGLFIDFVVGSDTQSYAIDNFYRRSVRTDIELPGDYPPIDQIEFDIKKSAESEAEVLSIWDKLAAVEGE